MRVVSNKFAASNQGSATREHDQSTPNVTSRETGLWALSMVARYYQIPANPDQIAHSLALRGPSVSLDDLARGAKLLGLKARNLEARTAERLKKIPLPAIAISNNDEFSVIAAGTSNETYRLIDAITRNSSELTSQGLFERTNGQILLIGRKPGGIGIDPKSFGLSWFLPSLYRYRHALTQVLLSSLFLQIFALITPLFFQLVIDKVLVHKGISTLIVLVVGLLGLGLFETILQYIRSYILNHTTNRIDAELGRRLFHHLLRLPLAYFESRPAGQTVARVRELETIRRFLTGQALSAIIDFLFTFVFIGVLLIYSVPLTLIILGSIPVYIIIATLVRPVLRAQINEKFNRGALSQQFLVETIVGVQTIKASSVEPLMQAQWEERLAAYIRTSFDATMTGMLGQSSVQYVSKVTTALTLFIGAQAVISGKMSIGELIAFNMLASQVIQPILRISQLWQDFQQVQVSISRLGDILNSSIEHTPKNPSKMPTPTGKIEFRDVFFRYRSDTPTVLKEISFTIQPGEVVGIIGASGSGKSTISKLIQRLYAPEKGQILLDGADISQMDPSWLRRQIGVVLQENLLFNRSIHDNIAFANPSASRENVMKVAALSGADDFIARLPGGYDTIIEERGANLSGGQRQRIAIARTLATNPRILILDEATSALDYESERIIQHNMNSIVKGRTVIIIAHRLAAVRRCNRIFGMKDGKVVETGSHDDLLRNASGVYARLWALQTDQLESPSDEQRI